MGIRLLPARIAGRSSEMVLRLLVERRRPGPRSEPAVRRAGVSAVKLAGGAQPPELDAAQLLEFAQPGWVKAAFDLILTPTATART